MRLTLSRAMAKRSCDFCVRRKTKCDNNRPCQKCLEAKPPLQCTYLKPVLKRGPKTSKLTRGFDKGSYPHSDLLIGKPCIFRTFPLYNLSLTMTNNEKAPPYLARIAHYSYLIKPLFRSLRHIDHIYIRCGLWSISPAFWQGWKPQT